VQRISNIQTKEIVQHKSQPCHFT